MGTQLAARAAELTSGRVPYVHAIVVRAQVPASARPGDDAIVLADGTIEGFVGGQCAQGSVRAAALDALRDGQGLLLRVLPDGAAGFPETPGASVVVNPCLSGGALEIFLEPKLPPPLVEVTGDTPIADAVVRLAGFLGYATARPADGHLDPAADAVIVASHGTGEEDSLRMALAAGTPYVALVASPRRGAGVLDALGLDDAARARVSTPAGLDIGARTPEEIALSILAEVVESVRRAGPRPAARPAPATAVDPICGMTVITGPDAPHLETPEGTVWFCGEGCRRAYAGR